MAVYYTIADTKTIQVGDNLTGTHSNITITPINPDTDVHSGYYLQASNFKVGGATETNGSGAATAGTNIYEGGNVDTGVSKVTFTNNSSTPGDINNTVNVRVDFGSVAPSATGSINIDIDEKTDNPIELTPSRKVCFQVWLKYDTRVKYEFYQPSINQNAWTVAANPYLGVTRTQTDDGTGADGFIKYKFEGTINSYVENQVYELIRVGVLRADSGTAIDTLPNAVTGPVEPNFSTHDFYITNDFVNWTGTPPQYTSAYNHELFQITNANNQTYIVGATLSYNPLDIDGFSELEDGDFCGLGHRFEIGHRVFQPAEPVDISNEITSVQYPRTVVSTPTQETITVRGAVGATYSLNLQKMESTTSTKRSSTGGFYSFSGGLRGFKDSITRLQSNQFTIGASGKKVHNFILPKSTGAERYEVFLTPTGTTKAASNVPTFVGEGTILRDSITTITIQAEAEAPANWQLSGIAGESGVTPVSTTSFSRRKNSTSSYSGSSLQKRAATAVSSSNKLTLDKSDSRIQSGMHVIVPMAGAGVPHNTTVSFVRDRTVILSNNCTIAQGALVRFESKSTRIVPFNFTIPAGGIAGTELLAHNASNNRTFDAGTGDWGALDTTGSNVSIGRADGVRLQVTTTTDNEVEGCQLITAKISTDGANTSIVAGEVYQVSVDLAITTPSSGTLGTFRVGLGSTLSDAFSVSTTETTYTFIIKTADNSGSLRIYNETATNSVFTVDNVSVKRIQYRNLAVKGTETSEPSTSLGGISEYTTAVVELTTSDSTTFTVVSPGQRKVQAGMLVKSPEIFQSAGVTNVNTTTRVITMDSKQSLTADTTVEFELDPGSTTPIITGGVSLIHVHAEISEAGGVNNQEVAQVYGYLSVNNPTETVTLPFYLDAILTSGAFS